MTEHKASAEQWAELRARVEALEAAQPKQITQEELARRLAQPASVVPLATAPTGSLVETPDELEKLLHLMNSGAGVCHSEGYEELHDAICRGVDLLERLTRQQPESIDEAENDRRFKACMAAIDAATPEQIRAVTPPVAPAPASSLVERVEQALEDHHVVGAIEGSWDAQARAAIREVAAALLEWHHESPLVRTAWEAAKWLEQEAERG